MKDTEMNRRFKSLQSNGKIEIAKSMLRCGMTGRNKIREISRYNKELRSYKKDKQDKIGFGVMSGDSEILNKLKEKKTKEPKLNMVRNGSRGWF